MVPHWRPSASVRCFRRTLAFGAAAGVALSVALTPVLVPAFLGILGLGAAAPVAGQFPPQVEVTCSDPSELLGSIAAAIQADAGIPIAITVIAAAIGAVMSGGAGGRGGAGPDY
jgi:hypothetical protein